MRCWRRSWADPCSRCRRLRQGPQDLPRPSTAAPAASECRPARSQPAAAATGLLPGRVHRSLVGAGLPAKTTVTRDTPPAT
ncbi:hypothetical protein DMX09_00995 [Pseudomonas protegens]|nr:hypothetical protein DMX09_00995 [Pseudomonas protegens]